MLKNILCLAAIFIVMSSYSIYGQETKDENAKKYIFSWQDTKYFTNEMGSNKLELRPDGRYKSMDEGTWLQLKDGRIRLASDSRYNSIYTDEFFLHFYPMYSKEILNQLPSIRNRLTGLLDENDRESYSIHEIENAATFTYDNNKITPLTPFTGQQKFMRTDVADLIKAIDIYLKDDEKNKTYLHAFQYPQYGFFKDDFSSYQAAWNLLQNIEEDGIKIPVREGVIQSVIERLNNLLKVRGLSSHFSDLKLSDEARALLEHEAELDELNLVYLNRLLLEAAYPALCPETRPYRKIIFLFDDKQKFENLEKVIQTIDKGMAPQFALRLVDKSPDEKESRKKDENRLASEKRRQER